AQISLGVAAGLDWYRDSLSESEKRILIDALTEKSLDYFYASYQIKKGLSPIPSGSYSTWWMDSGSNWNLVCNGSILVMLKVLASEINPNEKPQLARRMQQLYSWIALEKMGTASPLALGMKAVSEGDGGWF